MPDTHILITGCQRSGTTLLNLIMDFHPEILGIDEDNFDYASINSYRHAPWLPPFISFKLPRYAPILSFIKDLKAPRVIWCIRDPVDVIWSMVKLQNKTNMSSDAISWAAHPHGAQREIANSYWALGDSVKFHLSRHMQRFRMIANKNPAERNRHESIFLGALCWMIKNELLSLYKANNINFHMVKYETLVTKPADSISEILDYIGAGWSDDVLRHHDLHKGISIGDTSNTRPIDSSSIGNGIKNLSQEEIELIKGMCNKTAEDCNYQLAG